MDLMAAIAGMFAWFEWPTCSSMNCVDVKPTDDGVRLTSTLGPDKGAVVYTHEEWADFIAKVKRGEADRTIHPDYREATVSV